MLTECRWWKGRDLVKGYGRQPSVLLLADGDPVRRGLMMVLQWADGSSNGTCAGSDGR